MEEYKPMGFWEAIWGHSWTGMDSIGRWLVIVIGLLLGALIVGMVWSLIDNLSFIVRARRAGNHIHYSYRDGGPGVGIIVGNVVLPTRNTITTMTVAKGKKKDCLECYRETLR